MRVLVAFDKFKDALTAAQACEAAATALRAKHPGWTLDLCPLTDGGEGFCETLTAAANGRLEHIEVSGPRGATVNASIGYVAGRQLTAAVRDRLGLKPAGTLATIGMASASGLELLPRNQRDPWRTCSYGTGELIHAAVQAGSDAILLGVGGSATNELGLGALSALGLRFHDVGGEQLYVPTPEIWPDIDSLDRRKLMSLPPVFIACDVTNPLLGPRGATATFGPQKGLKPDDLPRLETEMARMASLLCATCGQPLSLADLPGTGAAGGIAFGLMVACGAQLVPGFDLVTEWLDLPARIATADLVLTGEGRFDATSLSGKGPGSLVATARRLGKTAHVFAGSLGVPTDDLHHAVTPPGLPLAEALPRTAEMLAAAVSRAL